MKIRNNVIQIISLLAIIMVFVWSCKDDEFVPLKINSLNANEFLVGDTILVYGEGFSADYAINRIYFPSLTKYTAPVVGSTTSKLVVPIPDSATTGSIRINILDEEIFDSPPFTIKTPVFESITPNTGYIGDTIVILGENFRTDGNHNHVQFLKNQGGGIFGDVISSTNTEIHVVVPEGSKAGNISVLGFTGPKFNFKIGKITGISPTKGVVGDTISITGVGFIEGAQTIKFNPDISAIPVENFQNTSREVRVIVPPDALNGKIKMELVLGTKVYALLSDSIFQIYPSIKNLSSAFGPPGYLLTIMGYSFAPKRAPAVNVVTASINNVPVAVKSFDNENIVVTVPANATSGSVKIIVNGRAALGPEFQITAAGAPIVERLSKNEGAVGDDIIIYGQFFNPEASQNTVKFGSKDATIKEASATELKVTVPEGAVTGKISVSSNGLPAVLEPTFTVKVFVQVFTIDSVDPTSLIQGETIIINGSDFSTAGDIEVYITREFDGKDYLLRPDGTSVNSSTKITAKVDDDPRGGPTNKRYPAGNYYVSIRYKVSPTEDASNTKLITIEQPGGGLTPVIQSLAPTQSFVGETLTITGVNFAIADADNIVKFGDVPVPTLNESTDVNAVKVEVPALAEGVYNVTVNTAGKTSAPAAFTILKKVVTIDPKPVYYLGKDGAAITINKIIKVSETEDKSTVIFTTPSTSISEGITAMVADLRTDASASRIYLSQFSKDAVASDGIFSMKLDGSSKKKIVATKPPDLEGGFGEGRDVSDLSLDVTGNRLYFGNNATLKIMTTKTNNTTITGPNEVTSVDKSKYISMGGVTYSENKVYYLSLIDDGVNYTHVLFSVDVTSGGSGVVTTIFDEVDNVGLIFDLKIDETNNKMYMLVQDNIDFNYHVYTADLNGANKTRLLEFESGTSILGISLDLEDSYIYMLQQTAAGNQSIIVARMDGGEISAGVKTEIVYQNLSFRGPIAGGAGNDGAGSIAVEAAGGGAAGRMGSMNMQLKYRMKKRK